MRTVQVLKYLAHILALAGIILVFKFFNYTSVEFWAALLCNLAIWVVLRLFAIIGQLTFEMRNDSARILMSIERSLYQANATTKEIRDLIESHRSA